MKPRLFIGSSTEGLDVAYAIQENLNREIDVTVWNQGFFNLSNYPLEDLGNIREFDFGLFVFTPDDVIIIRGEQSYAARDNVLFELGLFFGRFGRNRGFIITPMDSSDFRLPTDLIGITPAIYDSNRQDGNLTAALGSACNQIRNAISQHSENIPPLSNKVSFHKNRGKNPHLLDIYLPRVNHEIAIMAVQFNSIIHQSLGKIEKVASMGRKIKILMMAPKNSKGNINPNVKAYLSQRTYTKLHDRLKIAIDTFTEWLSLLSPEIRQNIEIRQYIEHPTMTMFFVDKDSEEGFLRVEALPYKFDAHDFPNYEVFKKDDADFYNLHIKSFNLLWEKSLILELSSP